MLSLQCPGFLAAGIDANIKKDGKKDIGAIFSEKPAFAAAIFTRNRIKAAPVILDQERIQSGIIQAVIVNSGNANCCTGTKGMEDALTMGKKTAQRLNIQEDKVLVASTGVIGQFLPMKRIVPAINEVVKSLRSDGFNDLAEAIMTTDTVPKTVIRKGIINNKQYTVLGLAKGSGMIRPDMATMFCFICTDVQASADVLKKTLNNSADISFNSITIDGDTSTNDTVLIMANGFSKVKIDSKNEKENFQAVLDDVMLSLARKIVEDGEGATKVVDIVVKGAKTNDDARAVADTIAHSNLVKTALFGEDANWGRIIAAAGRANVELETKDIDIFFDHIHMVDRGMGKGDMVEAEATKVLKKREFTITIDLNNGDSSASVLTCDLSIDYVKINADYRT